MYVSLSIDGVSREERSDEVDQHSTVYIRPERAVQGNPGMPGHNQGTITAKLPSIAWTEGRKVVAFACAILVPREKRNNNAVVFPLPPFLAEFAKTKPTGFEPGDEDVLPGHPSEPVPCREILEARRPARGQMLAIRV